MQQKINYDDVDFSSLDERFHPPQHFTLNITKRRGRQLRYGHIVPSGAKGTIVIIPGNQEPLEKYFEFINELNPWDRRWAIFIYDLYDQGGSGRFTRSPDLVHSNGFEDDILDLEHILDTVVFDERRAARPCVVIAHSKGGHFLARYLARNPDMRITASCLTTPMMGIYKIPTWLRHLLYLPNEMGLSEKRITKADESKSQLTHDRGERGTIRDRLAHIGVYERTTGMTFGWVYHALRSIHRFYRPSNLQNLPFTQSLIIKAGNETIVDNAAIDHLHQHLKGSEVKTIEGAYHDIWLESDEYRTPFIKAIIDFLEKHLPQRS